ncbi:DUF350 domain-containing protein [Paenibacillus sp. N1-5-1-14]|uniref:DUF350 domain-containing protein n=1 Tax=Paenibacillus radicibacter TaxID=2972488 RepID=UPI002158B79E|nr:DUF350 domain-containing protein [Paenibacillus radicibacter]MCR8642495.1 DUF350 domain-containing protein [Paenibacillus radicibacter]
MVVLDIAISIAVIIILQMIGMLVFSWITPFNDLEELKKGNTAVGLAMGGKFIATGIILGIAAYTNSSILHLALWFAVGYVCLLIAYWIFELITPGLKISEHLKNGNLAVGVLLSMVYVGISISISSLII